MEEPSSWVMEWRWARTAAGRPIRRLPETAQPEGGRRGGDGQVDGLTQQGVMDGGLGERGGLWLGSWVGQEIGTLCVPSGQSEAEVCARGDVTELECAAGKDSPG